ncbi:hypothetical protein LJR125_000859 [Pseudoxanthomonas sp. LjRoot125]|uniref:hypothetical protein n=1 Tax=Pseudoxanthomonas sp. LjRoot125 TaxID=3342258 RepID=UPI003E1213F2
MTTLSFTELDRRLRDVPDGPAGVLDTPALYRRANYVAAFGAVLMLTPLVALRFAEPAWWMIDLLQIGFSVFFLASMPWLARSYGVLGLSLWRWRREQVQQLDHDLPHFRDLLDWLVRFPNSTLVEHRRVARLVLGQLSPKIGMLGGNQERFAIFPVAASAFLVVRSWEAPQDMPSWQVVLAFGFVIFFFLLVVANLMNIRLRLYEALLTEAISMKTVDESTTASDLG